MAREGQVFDGQLVGPSGQGGFKSGLGPGSRLEGHGGAMALEVIEQLGSLMWQLLDVGGKVHWQVTPGDKLAPAMGFQLT
jgi:hypothetical protein